MSGREACPRCGKKYSYIEERRASGGRKYFYAVHYLGKGRKRKCYLGPNLYYNVTKMHRDLGLFLSGIADPDRLVRYVYTLTPRLLRAGLSPDDARRLANHLEEVARRLRIMFFEMRFKRR